MVTVYNMSLQTNFQLIFISNPRQFMKKTYSLHENNLTLFYPFSSKKKTLFYLLYRKCLYILKHLNDRRLCYKCSVKLCVQTDSE